MLLNNSREPIFNQATKMRLPAISRADFHEFLAFHFEATGRDVDERALDHLLAVTDAHPKRTQQLAWADVAARRPPGASASTRSRTPSRSSSRTSRPTSPSSRRRWPTARSRRPPSARRCTSWPTTRATGLTSPALAERYGLGARTTAKRAMLRLARRGLVDQVPGDRWRIIDPFLAEWLRRNSPFAQG